MSALFFFAHDARSKAWAGSLRPAGAREDASWTDLDHLDAQV
jgi:hypothetical protein